MKVVRRKSRTICKASKKVSNDHRFKVVSFLLLIGQLYINCNTEISVLFDTLDKVSRDSIGWNYEILSI